MNRHTLIPTKKLISMKQRATMMLDKQMSYLTNGPEGCYSKIKADGYSTLIWQIDQELTRRVLDGEELASSI